MANDTWRWAEPTGQQRKAHTDELRAALAAGILAPNTPVWRPGWVAWVAAHDVPELMSSALAAANGVVPNIPPPPLAVVAVQHEFEAQGRSGLPSLPGEEPPPPPHYQPMATRAGPSVAPAGASVRPRAIEVEAYATIQHTPDFSNATRSSAPPPTRSAPPVFGAPQGAVASAASAAQPGELEELSGSFLLPESQANVPAIDPFAVAPPRGASSGTLVGGVGLGAPLPDAPRRERDPAMSEEIILPTHSPSQIVVRARALAIQAWAGLSTAARALRAKIEELRTTNPQALVVGGLVVGVVTLALAAVLVLVASRSSDDPRAATAPSANASASSAPAPHASAAPAPPAAPAAVKPMTCSVTVPARVITARARIGAPLEVVALPTSIAVGITATPTSGQALAFDPETLAPVAVAKGSGRGVRRVVPLPSGARVSVAVDGAMKADPFDRRLALPQAPPLDIGVAGDTIAWSTHSGRELKTLFQVSGEGAIDALRAAPIASGDGYAIAFRRDRAIYAGRVRGTGELAPDGALVRLDASGKIGSPDVAATGDDQIVAWAERGDTSDEWRIRWARLRGKQAASTPRDFTPPAGGPGGAVMSPSVVGLGAGRFALVWTEGSGKDHSVRLQAFDGDDAPSGAPAALSPDSANAGQAQAAIGGDGHGLAAFLVAGAGGVKVMAAGFRCVE